MIKKSVKNTKKHFLLELVFSNIYIKTFLLSFLFMNALLFWQYATLNGLIFMHPPQSVMFTRTFSGFAELFPLNLISYTEATLESVCVHDN